MSANPLLDFVSKAVPTGRKLKILLYGASGSGKTRAALTFPRPLLVDAEGGSAFYRGRTGIGEFLVKDTKSLTDLEKVISLIQQDNGKSVDTLIIDPITVFYDVQKDAMARTAKDGALGFREWARINNRMKSLYNSLTNLPVHVIVIARESVEYEGEGNNLKKVGQKPDSDKALPYVFDFSIRMNADHSGTVIKSRGMELAKNNRLEAVNWAVFQPAVENTSGGKQLVTASDEDAIESEATVLKIEQPTNGSHAPTGSPTPPPQQPSQNGTHETTAHEPAMLMLSDLIDSPDLAKHIEQIDHRRATVNLLAKNGLFTNCETTPDMLKVVMLYIKERAKGTPNEKPADKAVDALKRSLLQPDSMSA